MPSLRKSKSPDSLHGYSLSLSSPEIPLTPLPCPTHAPLQTKWTWVPSLSSLFSTSYFFYSFPSFLLVSHIYFAKCPFSSSLNPTYTGRTTWNCVRTQKDRTSTPAQLLTSQTPWRMHLEFSEPSNYPLLRGYFILAMFLLLLWAFLFLGPSFFIFCHFMLRIYVSHSNTFLMR